MPLSLINIKPGFNKQITDTAAEGQYVDGDFVRFRSGLPEKIGGWEKITTNTLPSVARAQHQYTDLDGRVYAAIGTLKGLFIYYQDAFYDITPLETFILYMSTVMVIIILLYGLLIVLTNHLI